MAEALRRAGHKRIAAYPRKRGVKGFDSVAGKALAAALKRVFYQAAFASLRSSPESRAFYDRKRAEGKRHVQALIALARRRVNVIWAMLRDGVTFKARSAA